MKSHGNPIKKRQFTFKTPNNNKKDNKHHKKNIMKIYKNKNIAINVKGIYEGKSMNIEKLYYHKNPDSHSRLKEKKNNNKEKNIINKTWKKKDFELNSLNYELAFKLDHRSFFQYYFSLLKYNHPIFFSFGLYKDYNSKIIKVFLFFFSFCLDLTINALFFNDETMHKIYQDKGKFNILYQIPQILYSTLISRFIDSFIRNLALSQDIIIELKEENEKMKIIRNLDKKKQKLFRTLKIKFILFFIFSFIVLLFLWYYIICFCGIYINSQMHLIKDSLISLITASLIPFGLFLIPGILRICSLRVEKPNRKLLYKFAIFVENWFC